MISTRDCAAIAGRVVGKDGGGPLHLVFFVTNRCDFHCEHCFLIETGELNDRSRRILTLDEIDRIARSLPGLIALSLTGGEPFLRTDYADIVRSFVRHTRLMSLSTVTNGVWADRVLPHVEPILEETALSFFLSISVDGSEEAHDRIRNKPKAFRRTLESIRRLRLLRERYPRFSLGVNSTYNGSNFGDIMELYELLEEVGPHYVTLNLLRGVDWEDRQEGLCMEEYRRLNERRRRLMKRCDPGRTLFQRVIQAKDRVMSDLLARTYEEKRSLFPCYGGRLLGVLKDNGDVLPCEQLNNPLGNVRDSDYDFMAVWRSAEARRRRRFIVERRCHCTYECVMSSNVLFNPRMYPRLVAEMASGGRFGRSPTVPPAAA